ncbi:MAG: sulfatase-like hydrolase/transferase, partial [Proteiniphilum sp.]
MKNKAINFIFVPLALSGYSCQGQKTLQSDKMNIVFILSDDHRYDYMGFTGKVPWLETPNMDKMAQEGAWIKNAFVTTALSSPSR